FPLCKDKIMKIFTSPYFSCRSRRRDGARVGRPAPGGWVRTGNDLTGPARRPTPSPGGGENQSTGNSLVGKEAGPPCLFRSPRADPATARSGGRCPPRARKYSLESMGVEFEFASRLS